LTFELEQVDEFLVPFDAGASLDRQTVLALGRRLGAGGHVEDGVVVVLRVGVRVAVRVGGEGLAVRVRSDRADDGEVAHGRRGVDHERLAGDLDRFRTRRFVGTETVCYTGQDGTKYKNS
jgi:hypothetical protein